MLWLTGGCQDAGRPASESGRYRCWGANADRGGNTLVLAKSSGEACMDFTLLSHEWLSYLTLENHNGRAAQSYVCGSVYSGRCGFCGPTR